jgi:hypothetical protein
MDNGELTMDNEKRKNVKTKVRSTLETKYVKA